MKKLLASILSVAAVFVFAVTAYAATVTVTPTDSNGWAFFEEVPTGTGAFVEGPGGVGSAELTVDSTGRMILVSPNHEGTSLSDIDALSYTSYSEGTSTVFAPSLQFDVDYNLTDANTAWQGRLVYEPYMSETVTPETWQTWDPMDGVWWASGAPGNVSCPQSDPCTWAEVLTAFPNAGIRKSVGNVNFKVGGPWVGGFTGYVDEFTISVNGTSTTYDFELEEEEPVVPLTNKDQCKNGGYMSFTDSNGNSFKNQGQCVSYVQANEKAGKQQL